MSLEGLLHNISYGSELLAWFATVVLFVRQKSIVSLILIVLMSMILITETMGKFKTFFPLHSNIFLIQNIEMLIEILLFLLVYFFSVKGIFIKKAIIAMAAFYSIVAMVSVTKWQPLDKVFPTYSLVVGGLFLLITTQLYFYEGIKNMREQSFFKSYLFYISIGLFIFYANEIPVMTLLNYFLQHNTGVDKIAFVFTLKLSVSIIFYSLYSFGILWTTRK